MIREFEFFHGAVFTQIVRGCRRPVQIESITAASKASYIVDNAIGIYIKHSSSRMPPWRFTFLKAHEIELAILSKRLEKTFLLLVCNEDGIVCLGPTDIADLSGGRDEPLGWLSANRRKREMYSIRSANGKLEFKVGQNDFPMKLFR